MFLSPKGSTSITGGIKKHFSRFWNVKPADRHRGSRAEAAACFSNCWLLKKRKTKIFYLAIKMFHFHWEASVKAGEGHNPPSRALQKPLGQRRRRVLSCDRSLTPRLHYGWDAADIQSLCVTPQDPTRSVSMNALWKPCYAGCPPHKCIKAQPFRARSCAFAAAPNVEMGR